MERNGQNKELVYGWTTDMGKNPLYATTTTAYEEEGGGRGENCYIFSDLNFHKVFFPALL